MISNFKTGAFSKTPTNDVTTLVTVKVRESNPCTGLLQDLKVPVG
jgi:hypothetical protein